MIVEISSTYRTTRPDDAAPHHPFPGHTFRPAGRSCRMRHHDARTRTPQPGRSRRRGHAPAPFSARHFVQWISLPMKYTPRQIAVRSVGLSACVVLMALGGNYVVRPLLGHDPYDFRTIAADLVFFIPLLLAIYIGLSASKVKNRPQNESKRPLDSESQMLPSSAMADDSFEDAVSQCKPLVGDSTGSHFGVGPLAWRSVIVGTAAVAFVFVKDYKAHNVQEVNVPPSVVVISIKHLCVFGAVGGAYFVAVLASRWIRYKNSMETEAG